MNGNYFILLWFGLIFIFMKFVNVYRTETVLGHQKSLPRIEFALIVILPLIFIAGFRDFHFADTSFYAPAFKEMPSSLAEIPAYIAKVQKDKGFSVFSCLLKLVIGNRPRLYLFIISAIHGGVLFYVFRRFSSDYLLSVFLFVASTDFISWMNNGIRQFMAVALIFASTELMLRKKYIPVIAIILLASLFHSSALIMLPIIFIMQGKAWNIKTIMFIITSLLVLLSVDRFTDILEELLTDTQYTNVVSDWETWEDDGTNILRVLVYSVPAILSFIGRKYIAAADDEIINMATNASIISAGIYIISSATSGIFIGRLPIYVSLYSYILLPWEIKNFFTEESQRIVYIAVILCYLVFYFYALSAW